MRGRHRRPNISLPPEIWELIFYKIQQQNQWTSTRDLTSCSRTCILFRNILQGSKCTWLFKDVLPLLFPRLDRATVLSLRAVCKPWKWAVDHFLVNYQHYWEHNPGTSYSGTLPYHRTVQHDFHPLGNLQWLTTLSSNPQLESFLTSPHNQFSTVFPGKSLSLSYQNPTWQISLDYLSPPVIDEALRDHAHFWVLVMELLIQFGDHVTFLKIRVRNHLQENILTNLAHCLYYVPNLKRLHVDIHFGDKISLPANEPDIAELLPKLPKLECLEFAHTYLCSWGHPLPDYFQNRFAAPFLPQLCRLQLSLNEGIWNTEYLKWHNKFWAGNVEDLELKVAFPGDFQILDLLQSSTPHFVQGTQKLRKITLHLSFNFVRHIDIKLDQILKYILPFADTLEVLNIFCVEQYQNRRSQVAMVRFWETLEPFSLLANLKILHLHGFVFHPGCKPFYKNNTKPHFFDNLPESLEYFYYQTYHQNSLPRDLQHYSVENADRMWIKCPELKCIRIANEMRYEWDDGGDFAESCGRAKAHMRIAWEWRKKQEKKLRKQLDQLSKMQGNKFCACM